MTSSVLEKRIGEIILMNDLSVERLAAERMMLKL